MFGWIFVLIASITFFVIGWKDLSYYDELVPRLKCVLKDGTPIFIFPTTLNRKEKLILHSKIFLVIIGVTGCLYSTAGILW